MHVRTGASLVLLRITLTGGYTGGGGCAVIEPHGTLELEESHVRGCVVNTTDAVEAVAGGVFNEANGHLTMRDSSITECIATHLCCR